MVLVGHVRGGGNGVCVVSGASPLPRCPLFCPGTPAISVPVALSTADAGATSLPLSLQLIGKHGDDATVCQLAQVLEARAEFADKVPTRVLARA